jgi:hypothetical protein
MWEAFSSPPYMLKWSVNMKFDLALDYTVIFEWGHLISTLPLILGPNTAPALSSTLNKY